VDTLVWQAFASVIVPGMRIILYFTIKITFFGHIHRGDIISFNGAVRNSKDNLICL
jgi:hypothetical protein